MKHLAVVKKTDTDVISIAQKNINLVTLRNGAITLDVKIDVLLEDLE